MIMKAGLGKSRILVVNEDKKTRFLLRRCFEPEEYQVEEVADGDEMRSTLIGPEFDLIILDLNWEKRML